jgi:hypothetical protein
MENLMLNVIAYAVYLPIAMGLTWYVAKVLFKNAKVFMLDIFHGREDISNATNHLFQVGFYLLNIGYALLIMRISYDLADSRNLMEELSSKLGGFSIYLGITLFFNLFLFFRGKKKAKENHASFAVNS